MKIELIKKSDIKKKKVEIFFSKREGRTLNIVFRANCYGIMTFYN